MMALAFYLLKVLVCSGVLFLYYFFFLRNRVFHQWNRFYLLTAVFVSLLLPLLQVEVFQNAGAQKGAIQFILIGQSADNYLEEIVITNQKNITTESLWMLVYGSVSLFFLLSLFYSLHKIFTIIRTHTISIIQKIKFINTDVKGAPFSFLDYIFWNREIPLQTETGQKIFQHELVHVQEKHTLDKLLMEMVIALFWCNPFFWLIRKEIKYIHEFIADQKAVGEAGADAFAAMVLQTAYPQHYHAITNPFFQTSIKRRILMLTKQNNSKLNYAGRTIALPIIAFITFAFSVRTPEKKSQQVLLSANSVVRELPAASSQFISTDTIPKDKKQINSIDVRKKGEKKINELTITYTDGSAETLTEAEAVKRGLLNNDAAKENVKGNISGVVIRGREISSSDTSKQPLYILDGKEISKEEMSRINPNDIQAINVLKDATATSKYGEKGKYGVVEITMKKGDNSVTQEKLEKVFEKAEKPASVNTQAWRAFLEKNLQPIVVEAAKNGAKPNTYTVNVRFIVKTDGNLTDFTALNDPGYDFAKHVLAIIPNSPKWNPAEQNGRPVNSYHTQPITFVITGK
ncbi:energy transducer TonB [Flavisolibacter sp. BT320]|nr:energy transducer TonB [Flavisolibacter longurius]